MILLAQPYRKYLLALAGLLLVILFIMFTAGRLFPHAQPVTQTGADRYVQVLDAKIRYRESGVGHKPIILLHGFGGSLDGWLPIQAQLLEYRVFALDLVGFGGSDKPDMEYSLENHARYLLAFMDKLKLQQAVLVGGSMGGSIAIWTAAKSPDRIAGLVLIAPSGYPGSLHKPWPYNWFYRPGLPNTMASVVVSNGLFRSFYPQSMARQALNVTHNYNDEFVTVLETVKQPVLLAWSIGDKTALFDYHKRYLEKLPQAKFVGLPAPYAHKVIRKDPDRTVKLIRQFAASLLKKK